MLVTVYTDASWDNRQRRGGWAAWCRSTRGRAVFNGPCPSYVVCSLSAEMSAIHAGVYVALREWPSATRLLVCTDCNEAIRWLNQSRFKPSHPLSVQRRRFESMVETCGFNRCAIDLRWVRGHQGSRTRPGYVNAQCDKLANRARKGIGNG
jgi:ribonuclease HI